MNAGRSRAPFFIDRRKWVDTPHYRHEAYPLGEDEFGAWFGIPAGAAVYRGDEVLTHGRYATAAVVPRDEWWVAWFPVAGKYEVYVDIATPAQWGPVDVRVIDLDLDVVRLRDGAVPLVDEDEFEEHRVALGYPQELVTGALEAAPAVLDAVRAGRGVFGGAAARWQRLVESGEDG